jgi:hypothetical protein
MRRQGRDYLLITWNALDLMKRKHRYAGCHRVKNFVRIKVPVNETDDTAATIPTFLSPDTAAQTESRSPAGTRVPEGRCVVNFAGLLLVAAHCR